MSYDNYLIQRFKMPIPRDEKPKARVGVDLKKGSVSLRALPLCEQGSSTEPCCLPRLLNDQWPMICPLPSDRSYFYCLMSRCNKVCHYMCYYAQEEPPSPVNTTLIV